jgi:hypothetical protein
MKKMDPMDPFSTTENGIVVELIGQEARTLGARTGIRGAFHSVASRGPILATSQGHEPTNTAIGPLATGPSWARAQPA